ncbi:type I-E CRISPR-associated protein Cas7/Cse4/CasC [Phycicoccus sp. CSK15P-2]|uniref:type I-E CRISPR-associated protein Cas7/Cse4/CasC n=1 Tax=Phycicoccus sp. CSK15P-2 TaxID=2807627 RepID=UPI001952446D|nr:type I-E CRISPR-associated protein Cas7/Cse4/CasC [Phycicoccus sp. CSK15P-2]MBM6404833.1 type I-E CRISPR-associated protein Cas7/Cse4/CasC [Phycicoccus sp. CSK15P-2]
MTTPLYIDVHILQDLPPSNINRDDNGTPKQAVYGGVTRLRVSSQSWKRATRKQFADRLAKEQQGVRTRRLTALLTRELEERGIDTERAVAAVTASLGELKITGGKKDAETSYLLFCSRGQVAAIADQLVAALGETDDPAAAGKTVKAGDILKDGHSLDVALFGRMVADVTDLNVDAATQVAHAISTHAAPTQFDYFTAVDDLQEKGEPGAGMIGTVEYGSATMYRFATVGLHQLADNLADEDAAVDGVLEFVRAFTTSMPTGHQNSFAARTRPALVAVVVRTDQPVSLVSAFESPVRGRETGMMAGSQVVLAGLYSAETERWGDRPELVVASYQAAGDSADALERAFGPSVGFDELLVRVGDGLRSVGASR